jgi:hypothetical protein
MQELKLFELPLGIDKDDYENLIQTKSFHVCVSIQPVNDTCTCITSLAGEKAEDLKLLRFLFHERYELFCGL